MSGISVQTGLMLAFISFFILWIVIFLHHEHTSSILHAVDSQKNGKLPAPKSFLMKFRGAQSDLESSNNKKAKNGTRTTEGKNHIRFHGESKSEVVFHDTETIKLEDDHLKDLVTTKPNKSSSSTSSSSSSKSDSKPQSLFQRDREGAEEISPVKSTGLSISSLSSNSMPAIDKKSPSYLLSTNDDYGKTIYQQQHAIHRHNGKKGTLICEGQAVDSEVIYWQDVPKDGDYESSITPHHSEHDDRYITFEYDNGGWNNMRLGIESLLVVAHATGRTLVFPPQQHLYLLSAKHKDKHDEKHHDEMGFEDFYDIKLLSSHKGMHIMSMEEFLTKEGITGGLRGIYPPQNSTKTWGQSLWNYLNKAAEVKPAWQGRFIAFPSSTDDFNMTKSLLKPIVDKRMKEFGGGRTPVYYDEQLLRAHHIHFPGSEQYRLLQHFYAFAFFADHSMQSFYKRFIRDYMRYKDEIQCHGAELVKAIRQDAKKAAPQDRGGYYALHVRRGDFQFKNVKLSAQEIVDNLHFPNGTPIIPPGSLVYVSTDDPDGLCQNCYFERKPCTSYPKPRPVGCPEDTTWNAFHKFGWRIRFLRDYQQAGYLPNANPNTLGMIEAIACSRATVFAGTYYSTFTGYIHRLRGYHGLGEATYYHHKQYLFYLQKERSIGHGWVREFRAGWTDDEGKLI